MSETLVTSATSLIVNAKALAESLHTEVLRNRQTARNHDHVVTTSVALSLAKRHAEGTHRFRWVSAAEYLAESEVAITAIASTGTKAVRADAVSLLVAISKAHGLVLAILDGDEDALNVLASSQALKAS